MQVPENRFSHEVAHMLSGIMIANEELAYIDVSPRYFTGLHLSEPMFLGFLPNYDWTA